MKLVNKSTAQSLVEFDGEQTIFYNKFLEKEMETIGIPIPHGLRGVYQGKDCVRLGDDDFQKAFREIYYITAMNPNSFQWEE